VRIGSERPDVVTITAAMLRPVGLHAFSKKFPDRVIDVGIAEQHAVTSAAGLAMGGLKPVVCVYATFLNRAFDQVLMDVALHRQPVTFVLDRAGVTGEDGASHNGMWDMSILQVVPAADRRPRATPTEPCAPNYAKPSAHRRARPSSASRKAKPAPTYPRSTASAASMSSTAQPAVAQHREVLLVSVGAMAPTCLQVAERVASQGIGVTVVDPRWVKPLDPALVDLARNHDIVVSVEDNGRVGGVGAALAQMLRDADVDVPVRDFGIAQQFPRPRQTREVLADVGLSAQELARKVVEAVAKRQPALDDEPARASVPRQPHPDQP
jgi:1-deoxy-D-xylulose-5-phosphate synthase